MAGPRGALRGPRCDSRLEFAADVTGDSLYAVSLLRPQAGERRWTALGTDDNAPHRVFPDVSGYAVGTALELLAVVKDGVGTTWDNPRAPTRFDDFGAVFEIPLADPAASLNYIIHQPSGDSVPATREPGGDRSFVPAVSGEVWVLSGDPTIHTSRPAT